MKAMTPSYANGKPKENFFGPSGQDGYNAESKNALYQKAQNDVQNKFRISTKSIKNISNGSLSNSTIGFKRDETPQGDKKFNLQNFYGSPDPNDSKISSLAGISNDISKKNSFKTINIVSPAKRTGEKQVYLSYDFNHTQYQKKPAFKLDLSKRSQGGT